MHISFDPTSPVAPEIDFSTFLSVDVRIGTIVEVLDFPEARKPAYILHVDFGPVIGTMKSSAQITNYGREDLLGKQVAAVVNFPPRQVGPHRSEVLTLGFSDEAQKVVLFSPDRPVPNGSRLH